MSKVISLCSAKGGVGKTSCTVELACAIKDLTKKKVLVIDLDENCSLSKNIGAEINNLTTIHEVLLSKCKIDDAIQHNELFDVIAASKSLSLAPVEFADRNDIWLLGDLVELLQSEYDYEYIFIDNAPSRSILLSMTYVAADYVIIPTMSDDSSIDMVFETEKDIDKLKNGKGHESHAEIIGYILNNFKKSNMYDMAAETLKDHIEDLNMDIKPFIAVVNETIKVSEVKTLHSSMYKSNKSTSVSRSFYTMAEKIIEREQEEK